MTQPQSVRLVTEETVETGRLSEAALKATYGTKADLESLRTPEVVAPSVISLIGGQPDETLTATGGTLVADTVTKRSGVQSWALTTTGGTSTAMLNAISGGPINVAISAVGVAVHVTEPEKVTALTVELYTGDTGSDCYKVGLGHLPGGLAAHLKVGWNYLRMHASRRTVTGSPAPWGNVRRVRFIAATTAATTINIQQVFVEARPKASLLFIHDGGYKLWDRSPGYHDLRDRNVPVTWSVDCGLIGGPAHVTEARLAEVSRENRNSISFHGWDGTDTATMTVGETQAHTMRAIKWLAARGYTGRIWRSAWLRNAATHSAATNPLVLVNAMYGNDNTERIQAWPFIDRYNVPRYQLHERTDAVMDGIFDELKITRGVLVGYTHRVNNAGGPDITEAQWAHLLSKIDAGVAEGWLECVTLEMLLARSGVQITQGMGGATFVEWPNADGTTERMALP